ncbi:hypothetical protein NOJ05_26260 [Neorhizobium galegae]|uniref:hypothetical protein n=1 Tax=Neorhizobium galegae TaxID=399 RepID=UPI0021023FA7|nr:hypothetical protein [Neorhizobium galegae]MCQ1780726.1 hypothetical protein [Neorhizobium galegae]MCQ1799710.1 hypothetical protein [Neorhizobium galegae]
MRSSFLRDGDCFDWWSRIHGRLIDPATMVDRLLMEMGGPVTLHQNLIAGEWIHTDGDDNINLSNSR